MELLQVRRIVVPCDENDVVEAERTKTMQPLARLVPRASEVAG